MSEEWKPPPRRLRDGAVEFYDWQPIRRAILAVYGAIGRECDGNIPTDDWNLAGLAIDAYAHQTRSHCSTCKKPLWSHETIRCLDCKTALCESCAPGHFWPNGGRAPHK